MTQDPPTRPRLHAIVAAALAVILLAAGCLTRPDESHAHDPDARSSDLVQPGGSTTLTFDHAGEHTIHCHPHPFMEQRVTVTDEAPREFHVHILDGATSEEYRFEPATLVVGAGSTVLYHNHGEHPHTATPGHG